jgi:hypothetical protein
MIGRILPSLGHRGQGGGGGPAHRRHSGEAPVRAVSQAGFTDLSQNGEIFPALANACPDRYQIVDSLAENETKGHL